MSASVPSPKPAINLAKLRYILATDCGSTTTKAILIEKVGSSWRQTQRAEAPTTVEEPFANVTIGVSNSLTEIGELAGRRFIAEDGTIIRRKDESDPDGCDPGRLLVQWPQGRCRRFFAFGATGSRNRRLFCLHPVPHLQRRSL